MTHSGIVSDEVAGWARHLLSAPAAGLLFFGLCILGTKLTLTGDRTAMFWPANGLLFAILFVSAFTRWKYIMLAGFAAGILASSLTHTQSSIGTTVTVAGLTSSIDVLSLAVGAYTARIISNGRLSIERLRTVTALSIGGLLVAPAVSLALSNAAGAPMFGQTLAATSPQDLAAEVLGYLIMTPLFLMTISRPEDQAKPVPGYHLLAPAMLVVVTLLVTTQRQWGLGISIPPTVLIPFLLWNVVAYGYRGTAAAIGYLAVTFLLSTIHGQGYLGPVAVGEGSKNSILIAQQFIASLACLAFATALVMRRLRSLGRVVEYSAKQSQLLADTVPVQVARMDPQGHYLFANRALAGSLGLEPEQLVGKRLEEVHQGEVLKHLQAGLAEAAEGRRSEFDMKIERAGGDLWYSMSFFPHLDSDKQIESISSVANEITARRRIEEDLRISSAHIRNIAESTPGIILYLDARACIEYSNQTFEEWTGCPTTRIIGQRLDKVLESLFNEPLTEQIDRILTLESDTESFEYSLTIPGRPNKWVHGTLRANILDGKLIGIHAHGADVTSLKVVQSRLQLLSRTDELTGLPNRAEFNERLGLAVQRAKRDRQPLAIGFLDIDQFKTINDTHGHKAGDEVLQEVAHRVLNSVEATDTVARLAGDEFVLILEAVKTESELITIARKIVVAIRAPFLIDRGELSVTVSLGFVISRSLETPAAYLEQADNALYQVKAEGRNGYRICGDEQLAHRESVTRPEKPHFHDWERGNKPFVLVVEDDAVSAASLSSQLISAGYLVLGPVASGEKALDITRMIRPSVVVMDIGLEGKFDGVEAALEIQKKFGTIPVLFMSVQSDASSRGDLAKVSNSDFLAKPANTEQFVEALGRLTGGGG